MTHGWIILDKPIELGSTQAVGAVKRNLRQAGLGKVKVGHGGTLDPLAEGVLPIALGEATKLAGRMLDASKTYAFTIAFGATIISAVFGTTLGFLAAKFRGVVEQFVLMLADFQAALPFLVMSLAVLAFFGSSMPLLIGLMGFYGWERYARIARGLAISASARRAPKIVAERSGQSRGSDAIG